jgi:hypothetical protein
MLKDNNLGACKTPTYQYKLITYIRLSTRKSLFYRLRLRVLQEAQSINNLGKKCSEHSW